MTKKELENKIATLQKGIASSATPEPTKEAMKKQLKKFEDELAGMSGDKKPKSKVKSGQNQILIRNLTNMNDTWHDFSNNPDDINEGTKDVYKSVTGHELEEEFGTTWDTFRRAWKTIMLHAPKLSEERSASLNKKYKDEFKYAIEALEGTDAEPYEDKEVEAFELKEQPPEKKSKKKESSPSSKKGEIDKNRSLAITKLLSDYEKTKGKREKGKIISRLQNYLGHKTISESEKAKIHEFLGVNGKARHKEKRVTIDGRDPKDIPCEELVQMIIDRRVAATKSGKKTRSKPVMKKVTDHVGHAVKDAIKDIPEKEIKAEPEKWKKIISQVSKETESYLKKLRKLLGKHFAEKDIDVMLKDIKEVIDEKMSVEKMGLGGFVLGGLTVAAISYFMKQHSEQKPDHEFKVAFLDGVHDHAWYFHTKKEALEGYKKAKSHGFQHVSIDRKKEGTENDWYTLSDNGDDTPTTYPEKLRFDNGDDISKREYSAFENGEWKVISKKQWDDFFTTGPEYTRKSKTEGDYIVFYKK